MKRNKKPDNSYTWTCRVRHKNASHCRLPIMHEKDIIEKLYRFFQYLSENHNHILLPLLSEYKQIASKSCSNELQDIYTKIHELNERAVTYAELKLKGFITEVIYQEEITKIQFKIKHFNDQKNKITSYSLVEEKIDQLEQLLEYVINWDGTDEISELFLYVDKVYLNLNKSFDIALKNLFTLRWC